MNLLKRSLAVVFSVLLGSILWSAEYSYNGTREAFPRAGEPWLFIQMDERSVVYREQSNGEWAVLRVDRPARAEDFSWEINVKPLAHPADARWSVTTFWFRRQGQGFDNSYALAIRPDRFELRSRIKGQFKELGVAPNLVFGQWQRLEIVAKGEAIAVTLDGEEIISVSDGTYAKGDFAITNTHQRVAIGAMAITPLNIPQPALLKAYGPQVLGIPAEGKFTLVAFNADAVAQEGAPKVRWDLEPPMDAVSIDPTSGQVHVGGNAQPGEGIVVASQGGATLATAPLRIADERPVALVVEGPFAVTVPGQAQFIALGHDALRALDWMPQQQVRWSIASESVKGVRIDGASGKLTVSADAPAGKMLKVRAQAAGNPSLVAEHEIVLGDFLEQSLRARTGVHSKLLGREIPLNIYHRSRSAPQGGVERGILYVCNIAEPRVGTESDAAILNDYLARGWTVVTLDYGNDPRAASTALEAELHSLLAKRQTNLHDRCLKPEFFVQAEGFRPHRTYILPEGFRVKPDVPYYDLEHHAPFGLLEKMVTDWNAKIVPNNSGIAPITDWRQMHMRNGEPIRTTYLMDIYYPSQPERPVPVLVRFATDIPKDPNAGDSGLRWHFTGFTLRGGAYVSVEHVHDPLYRDYARNLGFDNYSHVHYIGLGSGQAALRQLAAHGQMYGIDPNQIFGSGHSKGQYFVTRMLNPDHEKQAEWRVFPVFPAGSAQVSPFADYPARMRAGYQSAGWGNFLHSSKDSAGNPVLSKDYLPTLIAVGLDETYPVVPPFYRFVERLEQLQVADFIALPMPGVAHELPHGINPETGTDNYSVYVDFFNQHRIDTPASTAPEHSTSNKR